MRVGHVFTAGKLAQRHDFDRRAGSHRQGNPAIDGQHQIGRQCLDVQNAGDMAGGRQANLIERQVDGLVGRLAGMAQHSRRSIWGLTRGIRPHWTSADRPRICSKRSNRVPWTYGCNGSSPLSVLLYPW